jgi:Rod binding domain-containing protein
MNTIERSLQAMHAVHGGFSSNRHPPTEHDKLVRNTQKWVAQTFYGAMLKEMRKSPFRSEEFEGGRGGEAYEEMFDQRLADHMSQSAGSQLVNSIVSRIEAKRHQGSARQVMDATTAYARVMQHKNSKGAGAMPTRSGGILERPRKEGVRPLRGGVAPAFTHRNDPSMPMTHRRQERILPEIYHVAPTD